MDVESGRFLTPRRVSAPRLRAPNTEEADTPFRTKGPRLRYMENRTEESQTEDGSRDYYVLT